MSFLTRISDIHLDILKEIGNIGAGHAATSLSTMLKRKIDMKVPSVRIVSFDEMMEMAGGSESLVAGVFLRIEGDAPGSMFFLLPIEQAEKYIQQLLGDSTISFRNPPYDELGLSVLQELGNILSGSYLTSLSDFTHLSLLPSVPGLGIDMAGAVLSYGLMEISQAGDYAIVIDTVLNEEEASVSTRVKGHFYLLPDPDSFAVIFKSLGVETNE
ncbi:chemotaxis protein CheC [Mesobacillus zeae]|uniref:Chemotaxis protein CheC n=1 Tax=Mesobacillus zeae TaxID=1917180 RepID=A0A398BEJ3_9BACI|nr:chemotaxis protein CheC [Mesobacillus zeae]RID88014.1 chemotaxis protein CheC [Mesobacillus zeae]